MAPPPRPLEWSLPLPASAPSIQDEGHPRARGARSGAYHCGARGGLGAGRGGASGHPCQALPGSRILAEAHPQRPSPRATARDVPPPPPQTSSFTPFHSFTPYPFIPSCRLGGSAGASGARPPRQARSILAQICQDRWPFLTFQIMRRKFLVQQIGSLLLRGCTKKK